MKICLSAVIISSVLLTVSENAQAQRLPPAIVVSNPQVYEVTITTKFVVPEHGSKLNVLRVWHALPTPRPWDGLDGKSGASTITYKPASGRVRRHETDDSQSVFWELQQGLQPGKKLEFTSRFRVRSADRTLDLKRSTAEWSDYPHKTEEQPPIVDVKLDSVVDGIKKNHRPAEAALEFCKWVTENIRYDASVPYGPTDLAAILTHGKGHCGHQMTTFEAMCKRAGIPTRPVFGLNLMNPGCDGPLHKIRPDYDNQHTWMQIELPGSGWVEIDPGMGANAYFFPAQVIQSNTDFQNYVIWFHRDGKWIFADWKYRDGKWFSPYGVENRRTFRKLESKPNNVPR